ncbi:unnamed protein product (macronuclear) [Paramecium tetraurelia]|uniref:Tetratricopeptide repeat protein n=1 Tax=Paramecium tetraurelia TaxID=5888 RepID=A0DA83_PARTE|nr:uncharacterized protein GSPATT00014857001 [Paramecium tetraurelia]CAK79950.1 unnamed protein product [Paramecium tetraurelia]|eukprot:XP_001447347.1 hypothetical protein (macronuclear) [Paramecium tetraurelia strain d4-2]
MVLEIDVKILKSKETLLEMLPKLYEILQTGRTLTISWPKNQKDIYQEHFKENQKIKNSTQYQILLNLVDATLPYPDLQSKIIVTLALYHVEQKQCLEVLKYVKRLSQMKIPQSLRQQYLFALKYLKTNVNEIQEIDQVQIIIDILLYENQISKEELKQFYEQKKIDIEKNEQVNIWFVEQIWNYEKNNFKLLDILFQYYTNQNNHQKAEQIFISYANKQYPQQIGLDQIQGKFELCKKEYEQNIIEIDTLSTIFEDKNPTDESLLLQQQSLQSITRFIELKQKVGCPIIDMVYLYQKQAQIQKSKSDVDSAIKTLMHCLELIKAEKLVNYNARIILLESLCYDQLGDYQRIKNLLQEALQSFQDSNILKEEIKDKCDPKKLIYTKMYLASTYYKLKNLEKSLEVFYQVLKIQLHEDYESHLIGSTQNNIASILLNQGKFLEAKEMCEQAIDNIGKKFTDSDPVMKKVKQLKEKIDVSVSSQKTQ